MKIKRILSAGASLILLAAFGLFRLRCAQPPAPAPAGGDVGRDLRARVAARPKPALTNLPVRAAASSSHAPASVLAPAARPAACLSEDTLNPLRRAFVAPRFAEDPGLPRERQTLLSNRLLVSPEARTFPRAPSGRQSPTPRQTTPFIVQFNGPVTDASRQLLSDAGATVRGFFPNNALLAELTPEALSRLAAIDSVQSAAEFLPADKLQPFLSSLLAAFPSEARIRVSVQTLAPEDAASVAGAVRALGGEVESAAAGTARWGTVQALLPLAAVRPLAERGEVQWIEERVPPSTFNDKAALGSHLNATNLWDTWRLTGKGQIVGHADTGLDTGSPDTLHPDFQSRLVALIARGRPSNASDTHGHGTHTAGSLLGSGAASAGQYRGIAWEAGLVHQSVLDAYGGLDGIGNVYELLAESYAYGARIHSDSWGSSTYGAYDSACRSVDLFAWDNPDHLAVFASGNAGSDTNSNGVIDAGSVGSPATAKNVLAVGAAESDRPSGSGGLSSLTWFQAWPSKYLATPIRNDAISASYTPSPYRQGMAAFSSRGPALDGRIKPELVASGTDILSCRSAVGGLGWGPFYPNPKYCFNGGTSMATPLVAGSAALLRQYAVERGGITNPSAALLKAMLVGGARTLTPGQYGTGAAREIPAASPNNVEGWGQPDLGATAHPSRLMIRLFDRLSPAAGATNTFAVSVLASNAPLDIALAWIDYPATAGAGVTQVDDLDLSVTAPDGATLHPNGGSGRDDLNTVETLRVAAALPGTYQIRVIAQDLPYAGVTAALYVRGAIDAPPVLVHAPLADRLTSETPSAVDFLVQSLTPLTNGEARAVWASGTAAAATGEWHTATAAWLGGASYRAEIPGQAREAYIHYYVEAVSANGGATLPTGAPADAAYRYFSGEPVELSVAGSPARFGDVTPAYGTNTLVAHTLVEASAPGLIPLSNGVRRVCAGWSGTGGVPPSGASNRVAFALDAPGTLTWLWPAEFVLTNLFRLADSGAAFDTQVRWHADGALAATEAAPDLAAIQGAPYAFCGWSVDGARWPDNSSAAPNPATGILMARPRQAQADYLPFWRDSDANGLSDWWELRYFGTAAGHGATDDLDGDLWTNLAEFLDNTDPRNLSSRPVPPAIAVHALAPFQAQHPPWTVQATVTDNLAVEQALLVWREHGQADWHTNVMSLVSNTLYEAWFDPPSHGARRVDYAVVAYDLLGHYDPQYGAVSATYSVIGDYEHGWLSVTPASLGTLELSAATTNLALSVANLAGPDLLWTARVAYADAPFDATNGLWRHSGANDVWCVTTNRTWNGEPAWYCGIPSERRYPNGCHATLDTPAFRVGAGGGLLFRQWIRTEVDDKTHFWDGGVVRVSTDGGTTFSLVTPTDGYPFLITPNPESPFPAEQPCLAGQGGAWQTLLLDLSGYAGHTAIVRFEFGSDLAVTDEGWYVAGVVPFSFDAPEAAWLSRQGAWGGALPDQWQASLGIALSPASLAYDEESIACIRVEAGTPDNPPPIPLTVRRGHTLTAAAVGQGSATADRSFLFRSTPATVTLTAAPGHYLYAVTVNGVPQLGTYTQETTALTLTFSQATEDLAVLAWFAQRTWTLSVQSEFGSPTPAAGTHTYPHGTRIEASVTAALTFNGDRSQHACAGWRLDGVSPANGLTNEASFALTNHATLVWLWKTNHWLYALAGANGEVRPSEGWYAADQPAHVTAHPAPYHHLVTWLGDTDGAAAAGDVLTLPMTRPRVVVAMFAANLTATHYVPESWLAAYGWASDFEAAAEGDSDSDGMTTWKEWLADTDPTNALSVLRITGVTWSNGAARIAWSGGTSRTQLVQRAKTPAGPWQPILTNTPPTPVTDAITWPDSAPDGFFRILIP